MDPLVFNIITSDSESTSSSAMKSHPGDYTTVSGMYDGPAMLDDMPPSTASTPR